jgi:hypothetical protein
LVDLIETNAYLEEEFEMFFERDEVMRILILD